MAFNDIYRLRVYQRLHGAQVVNVMHFVNQFVTVAGPQDLANDFGVNMLATMRARCSPSMTFESVEVQSIVPFSGGAAIYTYPGGTAGSQTVGVVSATLAEVITIYSERGGRRGRGRIYLAGAQTAGPSLSSGGVWIASQTTATTNFANALATRYIIPSTAGGYCLGVWSRVSGPLLPPWTTSQFARATALTVRTTMRSQRRRQVGVGR